MRAICEHYGLPYNTGSFWQQYGSVLKKLFRYALPERSGHPAVLPETAAAV